jgi:hypothetical protein
MKKRKEKPQKPRRDFPLTAHANGQWVKWIKPKGAPRSRGKVICFGVWGDPAAAERLYLKERADWEAGLDPRARAVYAPSGTPTLEEIADRWLVRQEQVAREGGTCRRTYMDKKRAVQEMFRHWRKDLDPLTLRPDDFAILRRRLGDGVGPSAQGQRIIHIRAMFRWAGPENQRLLPAPPHWGEQFKTVTEAERLDARDDNESLNGQRKFSIQVSHAILRELQHRVVEAEEQAGGRGPRIRLIAALWMRAVHLIAANTGAYASDIAALAAADIDATGDRWINRKRVKTRHHRIRWQAPLWPETLDAIASYLEVRPEPNAAALEVWRARRMQESQSPAWQQAARRAEPIFLTADGYPLVHEESHYDGADGQLLRNTPMDPVGRATRKLLERLKIRTYGLSFGAWRHTFKSIAEETGREKFVKRVMGHTVGKIDERYFKPTADQLRVVTDHVRQQLLPPELRRDVRPALQPEPVAVQ